MDAVVGVTAIESSVGAVPSTIRFSVPWTGAEAPAVRVAVMTAEPLMPVTAKPGGVTPLTAKDATAVFPEVQVTIVVTFCVVPPA